MTENQSSDPVQSESSNHLNFDQEEMAAAAALENTSMQQMTINYLNNRVVVLRAAVTRLNNRLSELEQENAELRERED